MAAPANNSSNLRSRVATAVIVGAAALATMFLLPAWVWLVLVLAIVLVGGWEWGGLLRLAPTPRMAYSLATCMLFLAFYDQPHAALWPMVAAFWLVVAPFWLKQGWPMPGGLGGMTLGWLLLVPTGLAAVDLHGIGPAVLLAAILVAVVADSAAYFTGRRFGRRKLAPAISPGKTWEGALGALLGVSVYALAVATGFETCPLTCLGKLVFAAWLLLFVSVVGDLFESHAKRQAGVKDSGSLLPGHGGVLDRIDSLTAVLPVAVLLWTWLR